MNCKLCYLLIYHLGHQDNTLLQECTLSINHITFQFWDGDQNSTNSDNNSLNAILGLQYHITVSDDDSFTILGQIIFMWNKNGCNQFGDSTAAVYERI